MIARRSVWADSRIKELATHFVPVADEVWRLHHDKGRDCDLFRVIAEQGHYAGRTVPSDTRQGIYCAAPSGRLLASINSNSPKAVAKMLEKALTNWNALSEDARWLTDLDDDSETGGFDWAAAQPKDSLVLQMVARDLDRAVDPSDWKSMAYNIDYAWFRPKELDSWLPEAEVGCTRKVDEKLVKRLAALHLVDTVRGQSPAFELRDVKLAELESTVTAIEGDRMQLSFRGRTSTRSQGAWSIANFHDAQNPTPQQRGVDTELFGEASYDIAKGAFVDFHLVASGQRFGATQFNLRQRDSASAPIGFSFILAPPTLHLAPANFWAYSN